MKRFEPVIDEHGARAVLVVGDVNSTLACTLVAVKKGVPVVHVEAGLRSYDRRMPEEINRVLTDQVADRLYTTERSAHDNLLREGITSERICFVGNVMIDSLLASREPAAGRDPPTCGSRQRRPGRQPHRRRLRRGHPAPAVQRRRRRHARRRCIDAARGRRAPAAGLRAASAHAHQHRAFRPGGLIDPARILMLPPQGYLEMLGLMSGARMVLTDSGGMQEETTALGVPCLTMRENTERPITVEQGTNTMVGRDAAAIVKGVDDILQGRGKRGRVPEFWDGRSAERIAADLYQWLGALSPSA